MQATLLTSGAPDGNAASHQTDAISPVEGRVYVCAVACERSGNFVAQSVSGAGLTWSFVSSVIARDINPRRWLQVFIALADGNATTGQLTITSGASHARNWAVIELQDVTDAVRNLSALAEQSGVTSLALTFGDAFDDPGNAALAFVLNTSGESQSQAGTDPDVWTQLADVVNPTPSTTLSFGVWVHDGETAGMTATWSSQADAGGIAFELPAAGGGATTVSRTASDSFTFADSLARNGLFIRSPADAFTFTDAIARAVAADNLFTRTLSDAFTFADTLARSVINTRALADSTTFTDTLHKSAIHSRILADGFTFADAPTFARTLGRLLADALTFADSLLRRGNNVFTRTPRDVFTFSERMEIDVNNMPITLPFVHWRLRRARILRRWRPFKSKAGPF